MNAGDHAKKHTHHHIRKLASLVGAVVLIFVLSSLMNQFVVKAYGVPTSSMEGTIMTGDVVMSEKLSYHLRPVEPGDIIAFQDPEIEDRVLMKRCIATEGQTVSLQGGAVFVDGTQVDEAYVEDKPSDPFNRTLVDLEYPYVVPEGMIWVMGDNRTNSADSRFFGPVPASSVYGRAFMVYWPLEHFGMLE